VFQALHCLITVRFSPATLILVTVTVLTDMPICDGVEACKRIRGLETKRKINKTLPIVALSADCQPSVQQLCLSSGMSHFLTKPLKKSELLFGPPWRELMS
jgi:CheY-like chemotaxis protein